jgi:hypothetical protein
MSEYTHRVTMKSHDSLRELRDRKYAWYLALASAFDSLTPAERTSLDHFRFVHQIDSEISDADWPGWAKHIGPKPGTRLGLVEPIRRRA